MLEIKYNDNWLFWEDKDAFALIWDIPDYAENIRLPHDAMIAKEAVQGSPNGTNTAFRDGGIYCYVKKVFLDESKEDKRLMMKFEGVYMNAFVYINGELAAKQPYGYSTFYVELDKYVRYREENEIRVFVRNGAMTNSRWYSGSGIYRDVYLLEGDLCHIKEDGLKISTQYMDDKSVKINIQCKIHNMDKKSKQLKLKLEIMDGSGQKVLNRILPLQLYGNEERTLDKGLLIQDPMLWDDINPNLYTCKASLFNDKTSHNEGDSSDLLLDESMETFGIRILQLDTKYGLRINGRSVNLRGVCIHHDSGIIGAATYDEVKYRQIRKLKEAGINAIRMAHNPADQSTLRACDQLGMYVMDEGFDMWSRCKSDYDYAMNFDEWWRRDLKAMVNKDYNHPSVIMYSTGNEIPELGNPYGQQVSHTMSEFIKGLDDTRYTLVSVNGVFAAGDHMDTIVKDTSDLLVSQGVLEGNINDFMALMADHMDTIVKHEAITAMIDYVAETTDIAGYNYMASRYEEDGINHPDRIIVGSETYPPAVGKNWQLVQSLPHLIGDFSWTGWDYIGEAGIGIPAYGFGQGGFTAQFPCQLAYCGDFDLIGNRRPASFLKEVVYGIRKDPYITIINPHKNPSKLMGTPWLISDSIPTWTWNLEPETMVTVEIYAPGDQVEILVNGKSYGRHAAGPEVDYITRLEVPYEEGEITAIAYMNGDQIGSYNLNSHKEASHLELETEAIDNKVFAMVSIRDHQGQLVLNDDMDITLNLGEKVRLLGFGSGDPKPDYGYQGCITKTFLGQAMFVVEKESHEEISVAIHSEKFGQSIFSV